MVFLLTVEFRPKNSALPRTILPKNAHDSGDAKW